MKPILVALVGCALASILLAQEPGKATPDALLKARIVQLEDQVRQLQTENAILRGQLAQATWPQMSEASRKARAEAEQAAGCALDWTQQPPVCKPSPLPAAK